MFQNQEPGISIVICDFNGMYVNHCILFDSKIRMNSICPMSQPGQEIKTTLFGCYDKTIKEHSNILCELFILVHSDYVIKKINKYVNK